MADGLRNENPDMAAITGSRAFEGRGYALGRAGLKNRQGVRGPILLVEIGCEEPASLVRQQRVDADDEVIA